MDIDSLSAKFTVRLVQRLEKLTDADLERMHDASEGPVAYYVRTSVMEDDALDRALPALVPSGAALVRLVELVQASVISI